MAACRAPICTLTSSAKTLIALVLSVGAALSGLASSPHAWSAASPPGFADAVAVAVDAAGQVYVTGQTDALDFPTAGHPRPPDVGLISFVAKFAPGGGRLLWSAFLNDPKNATVKDMAVDAEGNVVVTGNTDATFPTTPGAYRSTRGTIFVVKLTSSGHLAYSALLGSGGARDSGNAVAVDRAGDAYVTGDADQSGLAFPTTPDAFQRGRSPGALADAFVAKLSPDGRRLLYSTLLGADTGGLDIAVDTGERAYVAGTIPDANLDRVASAPITPGAYHQTMGTVFVAKLSPDGRRLAYGVRLGGGTSIPAAWRSNNQLTIATVGGIAVDAAGEAVVTGSTRAVDFPTTLGAVQPRIGRATDGNAFVAKLSPDGAHLVYGTYLGGDKDLSPPISQAQSLGGYGDGGRAVVVDPRGDAYVAGFTSTSDFPTTPGAYSRSRGGAFVTELSPDGRSLRYSTRLGGGGSVVTDSGDEPIHRLYEDSAQDVAVDAAGRAYVAGVNLSTDAHDFPTTPGAFQSNGGLRNASATAFVAAFARDGRSLVFSTLLGGNTGSGSS